MSSIQQTSYATNAGDGKTEDDQSKSRDCDVILWLYEDRFGRTQGPFSREKMSNLFTTGVLASNTPMKRIEDNRFVPFLDLAVLCETNPLKSENLSDVAVSRLNAPPTDAHVFSNCIAALSKLEILSTVEQKSTDHDDNNKSAKETTTVQQKLTICCPIPACNQMKSSDVTPVITASKSSNNREKSVSKPLHSSVNNAVGKRQLKRHQQATQQHKPSSVECKLCKKTFSRTDSLATHINTVHNSTRRFVCNKIHDLKNGKVCRETYKRKFDLKRHQETIEQPNRAICNLCKQTFTRVYQLKRHMQTVHNPSRTFICTYCGTRKTNKKTLECHMKKFCKKMSRN